MRVRVPLPCNEGASAASLSPCSRRLDAIFDKNQYRRGGVVEKKRELGSWPSEGTREEFKRRRSCEEREKVVRRSCD